MPYGYKLDGRKIVIDEERAVVVRYIFKQYANGVYVKDILNELTLQEILNKGKPFAINTIYYMLKSEKYTGIYVKDNRIYENMFPRIIDDEIYEKVRAKSKVNHYGKQSIKTVYLFKRKLIGGYCGKPINAECGTTRKGKKIHYYKCMGIKKYRNGCKKETIRQDILEQFLLDTIIDEMSKPETVDEIVTNLMKIQKCLVTPSPILTRLEKSKKQAEGTLKNIMNAIELGVVNKTTSSRMQELEKQLEELERQMLVERSKTSTKISEEEIREYYKNALLQDPLMLINYLIKEIKLYNDKVEFIFNSPLRISPDNQGFSFLFTTKYMKNRNNPKMIEIIIEFFI